MSGVCCMDFWQLKRDMIGYQWYLISAAQANNKVWHLNMSNSTYKLLSTPFASFAQWNPKTHWNALTLYHTSSGPDPNKIRFYSIRPGCSADFHWYTVLGFWHMGGWHRGGWSLPSKIPFKAWCPLFSFATLLSRYNIPAILKRKQGNRTHDAVSNLSTCSQLSVVQSWESKQSA